MRGLMANQGRDMMVDVIVYDWLRGKGAVISIHVLTTHRSFPVALKPSPDSGGWL